MMTTYALSLILFSVTLALLVFLVYSASRQVFRNEPIIAHRFALMALAVALLALPARYLNSHRPLLATPTEPKTQAAVVATANEEPDSFAEEASDERLIEQIGALRDRIEATQMALEIMPQTDAEAPGGLVDANEVAPSLAEMLTTPDAEDAAPSRLAKLSEFLALQLQRRNVRLLLGGLAFIHLLGAIWVLSRRLKRYLLTRAIVQRAQVSADPKLRQLWREIAGRRAGRVQIRISEEIDSPACFGLWRPVLILPRASTRRHDQGALTWALRHELVHIRRGDCLIAPLQHLLVALAWFHPAAWWLERELVRLRELSCDHVVVRQSGARRSYALALIEFAQERNSRVGYAAPMDAPALIPWSGGKSFLQRRIEMLAHSKSTGSTTSRFMRLALMSTTCLAVWLADMGLAAAIPAPQEPPVSGSSGVIIIEASPDADPIARPPREAETIRSRIVSSAEESPALPDAPSGLILRAPRAAVATPPADVATPLAIADMRQEEGPRLGVNLGDVNATLAAQLGLAEGQGVVVESVVAKSAAETAGLKSHDVIVRINGKAATLAVLRAERDASAGKKPVVLEIRRLARPMTIVVWGKNRRAISLGGGAGGRSPLSTESLPERSGGIGLGGGAARTWTQPNQRSDYLREIEQLQKQLAELEQRLRLDPQMNAKDPRATERTPSRRYLRSAGPDAHRETEPDTDSRRITLQNLKDLEAHEALRQAQQLAQLNEAQKTAEVNAKIDMLSAQREELRKQLTLMREYQSSIKDEQKKNSILERMDRMAVELHTLEAEISRVKKAQEEAKAAQKPVGRATYAPQPAESKLTRQDAMIRDLEVALAEAAAQRAVLESRLATLATSKGTSSREAHDELRLRIAELSEQSAKAAIEHDKMQQILDQQRANRAAAEAKKAAAGGK